MRRILLIATLCLLAVASCGCKKARLRAQLKGLLGSTIALPEKISCVYNGGVYPMPDSLRDMAKLIVYIDSTRCSTCEISHLPDLFPVYGLASESRAFNVMVLLSSKKSEKENIMGYLVDFNFQYPLFVDEDSVFLPNNPAVPGNPLFHSLLIDNNHRVLFVGTPVKNSNISPYLSKTIITRLRK